MRPATNHTGLVIGLTGSVIGLAGILLSAFFFQKAYRIKDPTFLVDPVRVEVIRAKQTREAPIRIIGADSEEIRSDVTGITFYFWNKGKEPIRRADILTAVSITVADSTARILDAKLIKQSRHVSRLSINKTVRANEARIDFVLLEKNDGATGQLIYEGNPTAEVRIKGIVEGVPEFADFPLNWYELVGETATNFAIGILFILLWLVHALSTSTPDPDTQVRKGKEYKHDASYRDAFNSWVEIRDAAGKKDKQTRGPQISREVKQLIWAVVALILVGVGLYISYIVVINEVEESPSVFVPESIRPTDFDG